MVEVGDKELVFSFLDVHEWAVLRVHFRPVARPEETVHIVPQPVDGGFLLATYGKVVLHLRPCGYPFAVLVSVGGRNALTGEFASTLIRSPQNYFATPPQGGIDGYFADRQVHPFLARKELPLNPTRLELKVFPMKREAFDFLQDRSRLIPGPGPFIRGLTLPHGGERQCEPVYEYLSNIGDWDQTRHDRVWIWLASQS